MVNPTWSLSSSPVTETSPRASIVTPWPTVASTWLEMFTIATDAPTAANPPEMLPTFTLTTRWSAAWTPTFPPELSVTPSRTWAEVPAVNTVASMASPAWSPWALLAIEALLLLWAPSTPWAGVSAGLFFLLRNWSVTDENLPVVAIPCEVVFLRFDEVLPGCELLESIPSADFPSSV